MSEQQANTVKTKNKSKFMLFAQKPVSDRIFRIVTIIVSVVAIVSFIVCYRWNSDMLWEVAQGREILKNGIPYTDALRILPDMSIIVQQWLYDVVFALFDQWDLVGHLLFQTINVLLVIFTGYLYLSQYKIKFEYKILTILFLILIIQYPVYARPEGLTLCLIIMECYAFERFKKTDKWQWLIILPAGMVLEANIHMSMIWVHLLVAITYIVPSFVHKFYMTYNRSWKLPVVFSLTMIPCMFINPYGLNGVLYLPYSLLSGTFSYASIDETQVAWGEALLYLVIAVIMFIPTFYKKKRLYSNQVYIFLACIVMTFIAQKNRMFMYPAFLCIVAPFLRGLTLRKVKSTVWLIALMIIGGGYMGFILGQQTYIMTYEDYSSEEAIAENVVISLSPYDQTLADADIYMRRNGDRDTLKLFAGFDTGAYYEYLGYQNVYMDARPELRMKMINRQRDELIEYRNYAVNAYYVDPDNMTEDYLDAVRSWINDYRFDYMVIDYNVERSLASYMKNYDTDYRLVLETDWGALYERNA